MQLDQKEINDLDRVFKLNLINSITGIKPANLIGTQSDNGLTNLAIFSSIVHMGSQPPLLGMVMRPTGDVPRHTYENIHANNGLYTINHLTVSFAAQGHYTSAKFEAGESEFDGCNFTEEYIAGFAAPFVKESKIKLGMKLVEELPIKRNGTILMVGEIQLLVAPDEVVAPNGYIDLEAANTAGISGLNSYYSLNKVADYPYARKSELPNFKDE